MKTIVALVLLKCAVSWGQKIFRNLDLSILAAGDGISIRGSQQDGYVGYSVSGIGDINGDHLDDVLIGAFNEKGMDRAMTGQAYVVYGTNTPTATINLGSLKPNQGFNISGPIPNAQAGKTISRIGDVDGDGYNDFVISAFNDDRSGSRPSSGTLFVIYGGSSLVSVDLNRLSSSQGYVIVGAESADYLGLGGLAPAGDVNQDGRADLIAIGANSGSKKTVYVVYGQPRGTTTVDLNDIYTATSLANGFAILNSPTTDLSGSCVSATDVNGDSYPDLIIGSSNGSPVSRTSAGMVHVIYGKKAMTNINLANTLATSDGYVIYGASIYDGTGIAVSGLKDMNGDGVGDMLIGAHGFLDVKTYERSGAAIVLYGERGSTRSTVDLGTFTASMGYRIYGKTTNDYFGASVADAGDVNADGYNDLLIGGYYASSQSTGAVRAGMSYLIYGQPSGYGDIHLGNMLTTVGYIGGPSTGAQSGYSVSSAGDFNGDGYKDIIIGAPMVTSLNGRSNAGAAYVLYGKSNPSPTSQPTSSPSSQPSAQPSRQPSSQPTGVPTSRPTLPLLHVNTYFTLRNAGTHTPPLTTKEQKAFEASVEKALAAPMYTTYQKTVDAAYEPTHNWTMVIQTMIYLPMEGFKAFYGNNTRLIDYGKQLLNKSLRDRSINKYLRFETRNLTGWKNVTVQNIQFGYFTPLSSDSSSENYIGAVTVTQFIIIMCTIGGVFLLSLVALFIYQKYYYPDYKSTITYCGSGCTSCLSCSGCTSWFSCNGCTSCFGQHKLHHHRDLMHIKSAEDLGDTSQIDYDQTQYSYPLEQLSTAPTVPVTADEPDIELDDDAFELEMNHDTLELEMDRLYARHSKVPSKKF